MSKKQIKTVPPEELNKVNEAILPDTGDNKIMQFLAGFRIQVIIISLIAFGFYCNTFNHGSAFDDRMAVTHNEYVQRGFAGIPDILTRDAFQSYLERKNSKNQLDMGRYRPLSFITFAIEQQFMGADGNYTNNDSKSDARELRVGQQMHVRHVVNVLLYIISLATLLYFLRKVVFPSKPLVAFVATLLFAIHPLHTEVVANVKSRDEILSLLFISLTFILALAYRETGKKSKLVWAMVCFFLALLSKEYAVTMIVLIPISFFIFNKDTFKQSITSTLPYFIPFIVYAYMRVSATSGVDESIIKSVMNYPYLLATPSQKLATEFWVLLEYIKLLFWPVPLIADYSYSQVPYTDFGDPLVLASIVVYALLLLSMLVLIYKRNVIGFALAFFMANLALVSNFFLNIGAPMADRLVYHSSIGFTMIVAIGLFAVYNLLKKQQLGLTFLGVSMVFLIALSGWKTIVRNQDWENEETLFLADVKIATNSSLVNNNAAAASMSKARRNYKDTVVRTQYLKDAVGYFNKAIEINPQHMMARFNRGICNFNLGEVGKAIPDWDTVRKYEPDHKNLMNYLGSAGQYYFDKGMRFEKSNQPDSAVEAFKICAEATPEAAEPWYHMSKAFLAIGQTTKARLAINQALKIGPNYADALKLKDVIIQTQNTPPAGK